MTFFSLAEREREREGERERERGREIFSTSIIYENMIDAFFVF